MKVCFFCRKEYSPKIANPRAKYCSIKCKSAVYYQKYYKHFEWKNVRKCLYCDKEFEAPTTNAKYCSESHRKYHWKKRNWEKIKADQRKWFKESRIIRPEYFRQFVRNRKEKKKANGGYVSLQEWEDMKKRFNYTCQLCRKKEPEIKLTQDHIFPLSKGGMHNITNIQPLCVGCNSSKNNRIFEAKSTVLV